MIVISHIVATIDNISLFKCQLLTHKATRIIENSLICATVRPAIKPLLASYPILPINNITIKGFPIRIKSERIIIVRMCCIFDTKPICEPKTMKKITKKKSLRVLIFAAISNLIGENDKVIPATSAPISIENQK